MPTLTRWFLRAAIIDLVAGLGLGLLLALPAMADASPGWRMVLVHLLVMGWATQMIFGVAYWMFPRRKPLDLTAFDATGWTCFAATNLGLIARAAGEPALGSGAPYASVLVLMASLLQLLAVIAFVIQIWPRIFAR